MIERAPYLWLATADADGWPDVSYKGGRPGWVKVLPDNQTVRFPSSTATGCSGRWGTSPPTPGWACCSWTSNARSGSASRDWRRCSTIRTCWRSTRAPSWSSRCRPGPRPELPPLHPQHQHRRALRLRAGRGARDLGAGLEGAGRHQAAAARALRRGGGEQGGPGHGRTCRCRAVRPEPSSNASWRRAPPTTVARSSNCWRTTPSGIRRPVPASAPSGARPVADALTGGAAGRLSTSPRSAGLCTA